MPATRQSWNTLHPMPASRALLVFERAFNGPELAQLREGFLPEQMEDKWFIFCEEDTVYFHRSWSGYCIFQLRLTGDDSLAAASEVYVNREPNQYKWVNDDYDERLLTYLIDSLLLKQHAPLPIAPGTAGVAQDLHLHHVIGAGTKPEPVELRPTLRGTLRWLWDWIRWLFRR